MKPYLVAILIAAFASGCGGPDLNYGPEATTTRYTEPSGSGIVALRPFPNPEDVCQVIAPSNLPDELNDDDLLLIGCPKHEEGAIEDRQRDGAKVVGQTRHWTLLQIAES